MRAIGYIKLGPSTSATLKDWDTVFARYCTANMHQPLQSYVDTGEGDGEPDAQYNHLLEFLKSSKSEFLIVVPHSRHLGEDMETVIRRLVEIDELGSRVACADIEYPDPLQSALHNLGVKGVSRTRSQRIKQSMQTRALQGRVLGKPVYGYRIAKNGKLEVVEQEASVVELIYRLYTKDKLGLRLIVQHLNERGITTRRGGKWNMASIRDILRNPAYVGTYTIFGIRRPRAHAPIVPPEATS